MSARSAAFEKLGKGWGEKAPGRFSRPKAWTAFEAACDAGHDPDFIAGCGLRFLAESRDAKAGRVPMLHGWLADERWVGFEPVEAAGGVDVAEAFDGPPDFVAVVKAWRGAAWYGSWLAPCGWDGDAREIVAPRDFTAKRLALELGDALLARFQLRIVVRKP